MCAHLGHLPPGLPCAGQENPLNYLPQERDWPLSHPWLLRVSSPEPNKWDESKRRSVWKLEASLCSPTSPFHLKHSSSLLILSVKKPPLSKLSCSYSKGALPWPTRCSLVVLSASSAVPEQFLFLMPTLKSVNPKTFFFWQWEHKTEKHDGSIWWYRHQGTESQKKKSFLKLLNWWFCQNH